MAAPLRLSVPRSLRGKRFDRALAELVPEKSGAQLQKLVRRGKVRVDGKRVVRSNFQVRGGEVIEIELPATPPPVISFLYEDGEIAVVDKPPFVLTHPADRIPLGGSVSEQAVARLGPLPSVEGEEVRPGIVHRLDRETSGVLVLARTERALESLRAQFRERTVEKRYVAIVLGRPEWETTVVDEPMSGVPGHPDRQRVHAKGREAKTEFTVLERGPERTRLECRPLTGRRHQLRVHLAWLGFPIVGDAIYGEAAADARHQALHAASLAFDHPAGGERVTFEAPPPSSFPTLAGGR